MKNIFFIAAILLSMAVASAACSGNSNKATSEELAKDEMYTCTMHNEVMSDHTGKGPKCDMKLVKRKMTDAQMKMMKEGTYIKPKE